MFQKKNFNQNAGIDQKAAPQVQKDDGDQPKPGRKKPANKPPATKSETKKVSDEVGTIRLSCDLARRLHTALRVAAALSERSNLAMIETLIIKHLEGKPSAQIVANYHRANDDE